MIGNKEKTMLTDFLLFIQCTSVHLKQVKEARCSFFGSRVVVLKMKII